MLENTFSLNFVFQKNPVKATKQSIFLLQVTSGKKKDKKGTTGTNRIDKDTWLKN